MGLFKRKSAEKPVVADSVREAKGNGKEDILLGCGLTPQEVVLISYAESYRVNERKFPLFWSYQYGIDDVAGKLLDLEEKGFIEIGKSSTAMKYCKASDLKKFLSEQGLVAKGKKEELIAKIEAEVEPSIIDAAFPDRTFAVTEKGQEALRENEGILLIHRLPVCGLDAWSMAKLAEENKGKSPGDIIWSYSNELILQYAKEEDYAGLIATYRDMARLLAEECDYRQAIHTLCIAISYELGIAVKGFSLDDYREYCLPNVFDYRSSSATFTLSDASLIERWQAKLGLSGEQLDKLLAEELAEIGQVTPLAIFTPEDMVAIIRLEQKNDYDGLEEYYLEAKKRFYRRHPELKPRRK